MPSYPAQTHTQLAVDQGGVGRGEGGRREGERSEHSGLCTPFCRACGGDHPTLPALKSQPGLALASLDLGETDWKLWLLNERRD